MQEITRRQALAGGVSAATALSLAGWQGRAAAGDDETSVTITVMGTSDLHGNCLNWDYFKNAEYDDSAHNDIGLAKISSIVQQIRADRGGHRTLLFDSGDTIQGTPLATYYGKIKPITETGEFHPMAKAMNAVNYDAVTLGNHEFNYGLPLLRKWIHQMHAPALAANAVGWTGDTPAYDPYVIKRMRVKNHGEPILVGVLGLTNPGIAIWDKGNVEGKLRFLDLVETAKKWVPVLKAKGCHVVVVTAHAGDDGFSSYGDALPVENASALVAEQVPDIDAILFGHSHKDVPQRFVTNKATGEQVLLAEPSYWGRRLSVMDFTLERAGGTWAVTAKSAISINSNTVAEDPAIVALIKPQHDTTVAYVNQVVAKSATELSAAESAWKDTPILDYIQKVQTETVKAALAGTQYAALPILSIAAPFSRTAVFPAGDVSIRDIAGLYIYDNTLMASLITGAQVKAYLEYSAKYFVQTAPGAPVDTAKLTNAGGTPDYNYDQLAGVSYDIDVSRPVGSRIVNLTLAGAPVADDRQFVIAVNNYRQSGGGGFPHITAAPIVYNRQVEIRQALIDFATAAGTIDAATFAEVNWKLVREGVPVFG
ncbi:bifunctional metallophosphatase/5'-nucleotidase [Actinocorallia longicatena]|uniref:5'-nucleotidase C-terminal domain-containing protein n=1 Tax=Actinocorallia longicatena TaxID=111803 RepID=A0ABP6Q3K5_9ACTN